MASKFVLKPKGKSYYTNPKTGLISVYNNGKFSHQTKPAPKVPKFDASFFSEVLERQNADRLNFAKLDAEGRDNELEYMRALRDTDDKFTNARKNNVASAAARGVAFSSGHAKKIADTSKFYNKIFGDVNSKRKLFLTADLNQRNLLKTGYNDFLRGLALQQAQANAVEGPPKGPMNAPTKFNDSVLKQTFKTPESNTFLQQLRAKYGI